MPVMSPKLAALERFQGESRNAWRAWLEANHLRAPGVWLVTDKKAKGKPRLAYGEAV